MEGCTTANNSDVVVLVLPIIDSDVDRLCFCCCFSTDRESSGPGIFNFNLTTCKIGLRGRDYFITSKIFQIRMV
jgi:hypothetical protein